VVKSWALSVAHLQAHIRECAYKSHRLDILFYNYIPALAESIPRGARAVAFSHQRVRVASRAFRQQRRLIYCRRATIICNGKLFSIWQQRHTHTQADFFLLLVCRAGNLYQQ